MKRIAWSLAGLAGLLLLSTAAMGQATPTTHPTTAPDTVKEEPLSPFIRPTTRPIDRPIPAVEHVLVVSIDGLRPDLMLMAYTPNLHAMMRRGVYTMWARTTPNSITLPSHVSMMTGVNPRRHDVEWNRDFETVDPLYPKVPTLFEAAKRCGYTTAMAAGKVKFNMFARPGALDWKFTPKAGTCETADVIGPAVQIIREHKPNFMLVHFPSVDNTGHNIGWASPQQMAAIADADAAVGALLQALQAAGILDSTFIIITADHGGAGKNHGPDDPRSRHIPWIANGPGLRKQFDLTRLSKLVVNTEDTFATSCWMLGVPPTVADMDGRAVKEILQPTQEEMLHDAGPTTRPAW